jgi:hypothetical protein
MAVSDGSGDGSGGAVEMDSTAAGASSTTIGEGVSAGSKQSAPEDVDAGRRIFDMVLRRRVT